MRWLVVVALAGCLSDPDPPTSCHQARALEPSALADMTFSDYSPWLSDDRNELLFSSTRADHTRAVLTRATRASADQDFTFETTPLTAASINTNDSFDPFVLGDTLYFVVGDGASGGSIHTATRTNGTFAITTLTDPVFTELAPPNGNQAVLLHPMLTSDELTIVYVTVDPGGMGFANIPMMATRDSTKAPFTKMHPILTTMTGFTQFGSMSITRDGFGLSFDAVAPGTSDSRVYTATRSGDDFVMPKVLELGDDTRDDDNAYIHPEGKTTVFTSNRGPDIGHTHLWIYCE